MKTAVFTLTFLCAALSSVLIWLSLVYRRLRKQRASLELQCEEAGRRQKYAEIKLDESNQLRQALRAKWQNATQENEKLSGQLEQATRKLSEVETSSGPGTLFQKAVPNGKDADQKGHESELMKRFRSQ
jgi:hypothetical protein